MLLSRNADRLVLNTTELNNDLVIRVSQRIPTLLINRSIRDDRFRGNLITANSYQGICQLTRQLVSMATAGSMPSRTRIISPTARSGFA